MHIFLSHAAEQRADAERLAIALRSRGHVVFLDADDLPAGGDYQSRIEQAIADCNLFCFLISPQSVAPKRFTLSELGIARRRWPNPTGHVLPIMVERVPMEDVPPYLRAVSILQPEGDLVADVLPAVDTFRPTVGWGSRTLWSAAVGALVVMTSIGLYVATRARPQSPVSSSTGATAPPATASQAPSPGFAIPALDKLRTTLTRFVAYMKQVGFTSSDDNVAVYLYSKELPLPGDLRDQSDTINAFYYDHAIYLHWTMAGDMSVLLREYSHHVLLDAAPQGPLGASAIESGLSDYYPASFLGSPLIGEGLGPLFQLQTSYIRRLDNTLAYPDVRDEVHARGEVLAGALWTCRQELGQSAVDSVPSRAWLAAAHTTSNVESAFGNALLAAAGSSRACLAHEMKTRKIPGGA